MSDVLAAKEAAWALRRAATPPATLDALRRRKRIQARRRYRRIPDRIKAAVRRYKAAHPDRAKASVDAWLARNPERRKAIKRAYYWRHREAVLARRAESKS